MGSFAFDLMRCSRASRDSRLIPLKQQENTLSGRYSLLTANAKAEYEGAGSPFKGARRKAESG